MGSTALLSWWLHSVIGGGLVLLVAGAVMARTRQPARQLRVAEWAVVAALLVTLVSLGPAWVPLPIAAPLRTVVAAEAGPPAAAESRAEAQAVPPGDADIIIEVDPRFFAEAQAAERADAEAREPHPERNRDPEQTAAVTAPAPWTVERVVALLLALHFAVAAFLIGRLVLGYVGLWRLARSARPAPDRVRRLFADVAGPGRRVRLLASDRVGVPFSCGLLRPTVLLPADLCDSAPDDVLRWVLTHELAHLERRDAWSSLLVGLGRALWFFLPWYGWLRRRVRLCQEYLADAAAVATGRAEDYAEFLVGWAAAPPTPAGAAGVFGHSSDLYRRITMLLKSPVPVERRCPKRWSLLAALGLVSAAVLAGGIGLKAYAAPVPKKDESAKEEPKKDEPKKDDKPKRQQPDAFFPDLGGAFQNFQPGALPLNPEDLRKQIEEIQKEQRKAMDDLTRAIQAQQAALGRVPNIRVVPGGVLGRTGRGAAHEGRLGAMVEVPSPTIVDQLDLPNDQGLIVADVVPDSAAAKAGVKAHDILLELDGKAVPNKPEEFVKQLEQIKANKPVDAVVMRKGKKETVRGLSLPEAPKDAPAAPAPGFFRRGAAAIPAAPAAGALPGIAPVPGIVGLPAAGAFGVPDARNTAVNITRNNDQVSVRYRDADVTLALSGTVQDGKMKAATISVQERGAAAQKYDSVEKVPEKYRDKVKNLIESAGKGTVHVGAKP